MKILVVDDNALSARILDIVAKNLGHETVVTQDGASALEVLEQGGIDLVLLDVWMPGVGGIELLERIRSTPALQKIPVIMCTGAGDAPTINAALKAGCNDYVLKPVDKARLAQKIAALVGAE